MTTDQLDMFARPEAWTPELEAQVDDLEGRRETLMRDGDYDAARELVPQIERLVPQAPFSTRDNGAQEYHEADGYFLIRNHGSSFWTAMLRLDGGGLRVVDLEEPQHGVSVCGDRDPSVVMEAAKRAAEDTAP